MRILTITLVFAVLSGCTRHIPIRTEVVIDAAPEVVFATLTDFGRYPDWNPYHIRVLGDPRVGADLEVRVHRPDGKIIDVPAVHVLRLRQNAELTWGGGIRGIFHGEHVFRLEKAGRSGTRLIHNEDFKGIFIGFADLPPEVLTRGYEMMNLALKDYIEGGKAPALSDR